MRIKFKERLLPLEGAINVRDIGGYKTKDGRRVKWNTLFRGDQLNTLTKKDILLLENKNVKTIIDYRSPEERKLRPNKFIGTVENIIVCNPNSVMAEAAGKAVDISEENRLLVEALENGNIPEEDIKDNTKKAIENYRKMVVEKESIAAFSKMLKVLSCPSVGNSLQHCRGGKDRTGVGVGILLKLLGVDEQTVLEDYELTHIVRKERNDLKMKQYRELTDNPQHLAYLEALISTKKEFLQASFDEINNYYGSFNIFIKEAMRLTENEIIQIKNNYLEEE